MLQRPALCKARMAKMLLLLLSTLYRALTDLKHGKTRLRCNAYLEGGQIECPRQLQLAVTE